MSLKIDLVNGKVFEELSGPSLVLLMLWVWLNYLKLKTQFLAAKDVGQIELPKFSREAQCRPMLIKISNKFQSEKAPKLSETYISTHWPKFDQGIERERRLLGHETGKGVAVEMILMSGICGPVGIRVMGRDYLYQTRRLSYAMKFADERHHVRHVFNNVATDDLVKFVIRKRIRNGPQVVNNIRVGPGV